MYLHVVVTQLPNKNSRISAEKKLISGFDDYNENFYMGRICSGRFRNKIEQDEREC